MKPWRILRIIAVSLLLLALSPLPSVSAAGYRNGRINVVDEPETFSTADVTYYVGEETRPAADMVWVDGGRSGKALQLTGNGEFLRLGYSVTRVTDFTFSGWINWQGDAGNGLTGQRIFTLARGTSHYLTLSPHMKNTSLYSDGGYLNGIYLRYQYGDVNGKVINLFNPTGSDITYALPQYEWHHLAVVSDGRTLKLYIDGVRWFEEQLLTTMVELRANTLDIGAGEWGDPTLNALLDDVTLYNTALSESRIKELAGAEEREPYHPTAPPTTTTETPSTTIPITTTPTTMPATLDKTIWGVPMWGIRIIGVVLIVYVILVVVVNVLKAREKRRENDG